MGSSDPDVLRVSLAKVDFRHPTQVTDDSSVLTLKNLVFEPLLRWQTGGIAGPALFDRWTNSPDGRQWRFSIRPGAVFHDDKPCTAADIIDFIGAILDSTDTFGMRWSYHRYLARAHVAAEGPQTVLVENPEPLAGVLDIFTEFYICRVASDGKPILGTGRYCVAEFDPAKGRAVLDRVPVGRDKSSSSDGPRRIVAMAEPSAEKRLEQLRKGEVDAALNLERTEAPLPLDDPTLQFGKATTTLSVIYYLNCSQGPFRSSEARRAVNHAVDAAALARDVFHGLAAPSTTIVSPFHLGARMAALAPIPYDPDEARRLLAASGVAEGTTVLLRTPTSMPERAEAITRFVAAALEAVGLRVRVQVETDRARYARQVGLDKCIGDLALFDSSPHSTYRVLNDKISSATRAVWWQGYEDADAERLISEANRAVGDEERAAAYGRCLERLRENPPWLYMLHPVEVFGARQAVKGLSIDHTGALVFD